MKTTYIKTKKLDSNNVIHTKIVEKVSRDTIKFSETKRCIKCFKPLKEKNENKKFCFTCYNEIKQNKKVNHDEIKEPKNQNFQKHFKIVNKHQNKRKTMTLKYTIQLISQKACNVYKYIFKTTIINDVSVNQKYTLNLNEYNEFLKTLTLYI